MSHQCIDSDQLPEIAELPPDSPVRREVESCPQCRVLLMSYLAFQEGAPAPGSEPQRADDELAAFIEDRIERSASRRSSGDATSWWQRIRPAFSWPKLVPVAAAAAVLLAVAIWSPWKLEAPITPRGDSDMPIVPRGDASVLIQLNDPQVAGNTVTLSWSPYPDADAYRVVLYRQDLSELTPLDPVSQPTATFLIDSLPEHPTGILVWRVYALQHGDEIAYSAPGYITLP